MFTLEHEWVNQLSPPVCSDLRGMMEFCLLEQIPKYTQRQCLVLLEVFQFHSLFPGLRLSRNFSWYLRICLLWALNVRMLKVISALFGSCQEWRLLSSTYYQSFYGKCQRSGDSAHWVEPLSIMRQALALSPVLHTSGEGMNTGNLSTWVRSMVSSKSSLLHSLFSLNKQTKKQKQQKAMLQRGSAR